MSTENLKNEISKKGTGIFVRENGGTTKKLTSKYKQNDNKKRNPKE